MKFEYLITQTSLTQGDNYNKDLDSFGKDSWELITVQQNGMNIDHYWKRELKQIKDIKNGTGKK